MIIHPLSKPTHWIFCRIQAVYYVLLCPIFHIYNLRLSLTILSHHQVTLFVFSCNSNNRNWQTCKGWDTSGGDFNKEKPLYKGNMTRRGILSHKLSGFSGLLRLPPQSTNTQNSSAATPRPGADVRKNAHLCTVAMRAKNENWKWVFVNKNQDRNSKFVTVLRNIFMPLK